MVKRLSADGNNVAQNYMYIPMRVVSIKQLSAAIGTNLHLIVHKEVEISVIALRREVTGLGYIFT